MTQPLTEEQSARSALRAMTTLYEDLEFIHRGYAHMEPKKSGIERGHLDLAEKYGGFGRNCRVALTELATLTAERDSAIKQLAERERVDGELRGALETVRDQLADLDCAGSSRAIGAAVWRSYRAVKDALNTEATEKGGKH